MDISKTRNLIIYSFKRMNELLEFSAKNLCDLYDSLFDVIPGTALSTLTVNQIIFKIIEFEFDTKWKDIFLTPYELIVTIKPSIIDSKFLCSLKLLGDDIPIKESEVINPRGFYLYCKGIFPKSNITVLLDEPE